jgi:hypothetical protein
MVSSHFGPFSISTASISYNNRSWLLSRHLGKQAVTYPKALATDFSYFFLVLCAYSHQGEREGVRDRDRETDRERESKIPPMFGGRRGQSYVTETKTLRDFICSKQLRANWNVGREISAFRREVDENCALLGYYAVVIPYRCFKTTYNWCICSFSRIY